MLRRRRQAAASKHARRALEASFQAQRLRASNLGCHAQLARRRERLSRELAREVRDVLVHALGEHRHLLAGGGERAPVAVALEQFHAEGAGGFAKWKEQTAWH
jgi:hypothetical protein